MSKRIKSAKKSKILFGESVGKDNKSLVRIKVVGIGGAGGNVLTRMGSDFVRGVEFIAINTDAQDLDHCEAKHKIYIGRLATRGLGAGMNPDLGRQAAEESQAEIAEALKGADMIFLTAGFGGGTGTGATPVIADLARETGALTVAVITKPFTFEGSQRMKIAEEGLLKLKDKVDTMLVIPNDRIFSIIDNDTPILKAFEKIDDVLKSAVAGVTEIIASSGLINVDFADVRAIMSGSGTAVVGVGIAEGKERSFKAATQAVSSPLLETSIEGAKGVLFCVAGGRDMKMVEISEIAKIVTENVDQGAKIIFGAYLDRKLKAGQIKVTLVATGFNGLTFKKDDGLTLFSANQITAKAVTERMESRLDSDSNHPSLEKNKKAVPEIAQEEEDIWEIPAFLRKKKK